MALCLIFSTSYSQNWIIAKHGGGGGTHGDGAGKIAVDNLGNVYITGGYSATSFFDNDTVYSINSFGMFFLAKYNSSGNLLWVQTGGGSLANRGNSGLSLKVDANGACYVTGIFCGTANFDTVQLTSYGDNDIFIAKFDSSGSCLWAKKAGGSGYDVGRDIELDADNNIYITGNTNSTLLHFDAITISNTANKFFLAKYDNNGNCIWAQISGGAGDGSGNGLSCYNNKLFVAGYFVSTCIFGSITLIDLTGNGAGLIAQYDTAGTCLWAKSTFGGGGNAVNHDSLGNCYETGTFMDSATFDTIHLYNATHTDCFLAKCDVNGNFIWAKQLNATNVAEGNSLTTNNIGETYITGLFFGNATFGSTNLTSLGQDIFVAKYDSSGNCIGATHVGTTGANDVGEGVTIDINGYCYITGEFTDTANFGSIPLVSYGNQDAFWAKMDAITGGGEIGGRATNNQLIIYANPTAGKCNITVPDEFLHEKNLVLSIFDNTDKLIQQKTLEMNEGKIKVSLEAEAKGIYNVTLSNGKKSYGGKIVFE